MYFQNCTWLILPDLFFQRLFQLCISNVQKSKGVFKKSVFDSLSQIFSIKGWAVGSRSRRGNSTVSAIPATNSSLKIQIQYLSITAQPYQIHIPEILDILHVSLLNLNKFSLSRTSSVRKINPPHLQQSGFRCRCFSLKTYSHSYSLPLGPAAKNLSNVIETECN